MKQVVLNLQEYEATLQDIRRLKDLCARAACVLSFGVLDEEYAGHWDKKLVSEFVIELRKAAE